MQFVGFGTGGQWGIYNDVGGTLHLIADKNTPIPDGTGNFTSFNSSYAPGLNNGNSSFEGSGAGQDGTYTDIGGMLTTVANKSTMIDGKSVFSFSPGVGPQGLSNGNIAAYVQFISAAAGVYVAEQSYDYTANASGAWDTASNWSFGLKPRAVVSTNIHPDNGVLLTGPASATTVRSLDLGSNFSGVAELRLQPTGQLTVNEYMYVESLGKLSVNGGSLSAGNALYNYGEIDLGGGQISGGVFFNNNAATLQGSGTVGNYLYNYGHIQAINSNTLYTAPVTNSVILNPDNTPFAIGQIDIRNAQLQFAGGLSNAGSMNFSFGTSDVFGAVNNMAADSIAMTPGGQIIVSGNSNVTFYDSVVHNGDVFRVSSGSTLVFFGQVSGAGAFTGTGAKFFEGGYSPGNSPAVVSLDGPVTFGDTNSLKIELGGTAVGSQFDHVNVTGHLTLGGALNVVLYNGFKPAAGNTFDILDWTALSGTFDSVTLPTMNGRIVWDSSHLYDTGALGGTLSVLATYYAGDINRDSHVTVADVSALMTALSDLSNYQSSHSGMTDPQFFRDVADVNGDGQVNNADLQALISLVANGPDSGSGALTAVPEPATINMMLIGAMAGLAITLASRRH